MKKKRCGKCFADVQSTAIYCPHCGIVDSWLPTPEGAPAIAAQDIWQPTAAEASSTSKLPVPDADATRRELVDNSLGEVTVSQYRERLAKEIAELKYQQWRELQPDWHEATKDTPLNVNNQFARGGAIASTFQNPMIATAAGVVLGTTAMRYQLGEIQNELEAQNLDQGGAADSSGGFMDGFDGGF
jgi:predicted  nucleic acid-binding Zn-ribbon protein